MSSPSVPHTLTPENASQVWSALSDRVDELISAWETESEPPSLDRFLPAEPPALRRFMLVELIKVDLEFRYEQAKAPKQLADYLVEFPELAADDGIPCGLIYEEFHIRKRAGEAVDAAAYCKQYPAQARELGQLLCLESRHATTVVLGATRPKELDVGDSVDDFDLLTRLGKGAFASVYLARQRSMQRIVALKVSADRGSEPQTMAQLDHPHIVRVYDQRILPDDKLRLLYMQHIPGGTLESVVEVMRRTPLLERSGRTLLLAVDRALERRGESPPIDSHLRERLAGCTWPEVVCWLGARLAGALDYAHQRGVLHRDIKPANVLVAADGSPKLADFNISYSSKLDGVTPAAYFGGSLAYMSPEQLEAYNPAHDRTADELDGRSDIYSLGVMLWELLTGERPWKDQPLDGNWPRTLERMVALRRAGLSQATLRQLPLVMPPCMDQVLARCLAANPEDRFPTGAELARQLELCLQPRTQRLLRPRQRSIQRFLQRQPLWSMLAAGLAPNVLISGVNIVYNHEAFIKYLSPAAQELFRRVQLLVVNGVCYPLATIILILIALPILKAVWRVQHGGELDSAFAARTRRRVLAYGDLVAVVSAVTWLLSGVIFPLWIRVHEGDSPSAGLQTFLQFLASQALSGLLAATLTFFLLTFVMVRLVYPLLINASVPHADELGGLRNLAWRVWIYFGLAVTVPFLAVIIVSLVQTRLSALIGVLGVVGLFGFILAFVLAHAIRRDLESLAVAVAPPGDAVGASTDSFWTASR